MISLTLSWERILGQILEICERTDTLYHRIYLDYVEYTIESVKDRWKYLTLLDAMLTICFKPLSCDYTISRKRFNIYIVIRDIILSACAERLVSLFRQPSLCDTIDYSMRDGRCYTMLSIG